MRDPVELLPGAFHVPLNRFADARGSFVKTYAAGAFAALGLVFERRESFYSVSGRGVIRGMHFQRPPHDHDKVVHCACGSALDVLLDLRPGPGFGVARSVLLDAARPALVFIPKGVAHGFKALADDTLLCYDTSTEHALTHDAGVRWDGFGFDWGEGAVIVSERDRGHPALSELANPFVAA
jgi:dTDP-4-dehydrorhamnose 3,5-epimerase/CDP-3, 6-dideoxy-D-glycero-D-glycero-4-hexulose-5-epimerase